MDRIVDILIKSYECDARMISEPWMWIPFLIPITGYVFFMVCKWTLLTMPIWLPLSIVGSILKGMSEAMRLHAPMPPLSRFRSSEN